MKKNILIVIFLAVFAAGMYSLEAALDYDLFGKYSSEGHYEVDFNLLHCLLWAGLGAAVGAGSMLIDKIRSGGSKD